MFGLDSPFRAGRPPTQLLGPTARQVERDPSASLAQRSVVSERTFVSIRHQASDGARRSARDELAALINAAPATYTAPHPHQLFAATGLMMHAYIDIIASQREFKDDYARRELLPRLAMIVDHPLATFVSII